jgi:hypothetical protein
MPVCETCGGTGEPLEAHEADKETRCHMCEGTGVIGQMTEQETNHHLFLYLKGAGMLNYQNGAWIEGKHTFTISGTISLSTGPNLYWLESQTEVTLGHKIDKKV